MSSAALEERSEVLREELAYHEHRFHVLEYPLISKRRYLAMREELSLLEKESGVRVTFDSASLRDGAAKRATIERAPHRPAWTDFPAIRSPAELRRYIDELTKREGGRPPVCIGTAGMTGVEVVLSYVDGTLRKAVTKGDGREGVDVTDNVRTIGSVPLRLRPPGSITESRVSRVTPQGAAGPSTATPVPPFPPELFVRGIVTMRNADLLALERRRIDAGEAPYVLPQAAISSSLVRLDPRITRSRRLRFFATDTLEAPVGIDTEWQLLGALKSWGFSVTSLTWRCVGYDEILDFVSALQQEKVRFDFPLDGGILKANRIWYDEPEPARDPKSPPPFPRIAMLTFASIGKRAKVQSVYRAVGRTGAVLPVALIQREGTASSTPDGVPLPARSSTETLALDEGMTVRAVPGGIAPVLELDPPNQQPKASQAETCPACKGPMRRPADEPFAYCDNSTCRGRIRSRLLHLIGARGLMLKSVNARVLEGLFKGSAVSLCDVFELDPKQVEAVSAGAGELFRAEIERAKKLPLWRMLYLSSIDQVGERAARLIASWCGDVEGMLGGDARGTAVSVPDLAPEAADGFVRWLEKDARSVLERLARAGVRLLSDDEAFAAPLAGRRLVLGGKLEVLSHDRAVDEIERRGGAVDSRVTRRTDLVVTGKDAQEATAEAEAFRVALVEEQTLLGLLRLT